jgi:hypothetical protein
VRRAHRVDIYLRALTRQPACRAGVVEVDMGQKDVRYVRGGQAIRSKTLL